MTYDQALAYIASLEGRGWRLGLDRMEEMVRRSGLSDSIGGPTGPQYIHVAGTNGKGSTTAFLQSILVASGYRTGAFFSPYVVDPRERVQLNREMISKPDLVAVAEKLIPIAESFSETDFGGITEFEFKTAIGFEYWKQKQCEWVALEVGLGGRLDATNVISPRASVIVSIGLDHINILGGTLDKIAYEKAGIIKPGVPIIVGNMPEAAREVILREAREREAPVWLWGRDIRWIPEDHAVETPAGRHPGLTPSLVGPIQTHNLTVAIAAIDASGAFVSEEALVEGARLAAIPGRFQVITYQGRTVIFDGAHNPDSANVLVQTLNKLYPDQKIVLVTNMLAGHEPEEFYRTLEPRVQSVHVVPVDFHRSTPVATMVDKLSPIFKNVNGHPTPIEGLNAATKDASESDLIVVTGSFYLVGELLRELTILDNTCRSSEQKPLEFL